MIAFSNGADLDGEYHHLRIIFVYQLLFIIVKVCLFLFYFAIFKKVLLLAWFRWSIEVITSIMSINASFRQIRNNFIVLNFLYLGLWIDLSISSGVILLRILLIWKLMVIYRCLYQLIHLICNKKPTKLHKMIDLFLLKFILLIICWIQSIFANSFQYFGSMEQLMVSCWGSWI